jgi:hypothetical protein
MEHFCYLFYAYMFMLPVETAESTEKCGTSGWPDYSEPYSGLTSSNLCPGTKYPDYGFW